MFVSLCRFFFFLASIQLEEWQLYVWHRDIAPYERIAKEKRLKMNWSIGFESKDDDDDDDRLSDLIGFITLHVNYSVIVTSLFILFYSK